MPFSLTPTIVFFTFIFACCAVPLSEGPQDQAAFTTPGSHRASLPVDNPTRSFWLDSPGANPLAEEGAHDPIPDDAQDVCIIGSGMTGVSVAYHLSKEVVETPLKVVILEARKFC